MLAGCAMLNCSKHKGFSMSDEAEARQKREETVAQPNRFKIGDRVMMVAGIPTGTAGVIVRLPEKATRSTRRTW